MTTKPHNNDEVMNEFETKIAALEIDYTSRGHGYISQYQWDSLSEWLRNLLAQKNTEIVDARREERLAFCTILEKLYQAGDDRKTMTMEYLMRIRSKDAGKTPQAQTANPTN